LEIQLDDGMAVSVKGVNGECTKRDVGHTEPSKRIHVVDNKSEVLILDVDLIGFERLQLLPRDQSTLFLLVFVELIFVIGATTVHFIVVLSRRCSRNSGLNIQHHLVDFIVVARCTRKIVTQ